MDFGTKMLRWFRCSVLLQYVIFSHIGVLVMIDNRYYLSTNNSRYKK